MIIMHPLQQALTHDVSYICDIEILEIHAYRPWSHRGLDGKNKHLVLQNGLPHQNQMQVKMTYSTRETRSM